MAIAQAVWFLPSLSLIAIDRPRDDMLTAALLRTTVLPASPPASGHRRAGLTGLATLYIDKKLMDEFDIDFIVTDFASRN
ncbi:hypothetical protein QYE76_012616 [Lolium multiflorum]|uniref:Uncharacterized protein n=1 Tax=Lolium multiflorum TaxID=4521 RepID=A0AAD8U1A0_LOLMU|nr:hypothetical protein QYE76_012616 [Lolium multiflorum]